MLKWTTETGETRHLAVHALPAWGGGSQCDTADIIAALKANPEACAEVLAGMGTTHFAARDAEWWHDRFVAEKARAERAEHSLAASERALAALRYQAEAGGCELSTVGENFYHCRADALCGLCRLRHRAEQAERDLAALRDQVAVAGCECSTFGERTYNCRHDNLCGLCRLRHRAENAERERDEARAALADAERRALCAGVDALPTDATIIKTSNLEALRSDLAIVTDERNALRSALTDSQQAIVGSMRARVMTGTYRPWNPCPLCAPRPELDPESPATRREVEELRRQVERLEGLTGFGPEE